MLAETLDKKSEMHIKANVEAMDLSDSTKFYRYEIEQVELLSTEEVTRLAQRIERGKGAKRQRNTSLPCSPHDTEDAAEAKCQLIEANLRLVLHWAKKYKGFGVDLMDLVQEGSLGLMHAIDKFDYRKGYKFSTYATWWIRQYITHAIAKQADTIRVPVYKIEEIKRLGRVRRRLQQEGGVEEPAVEALAREMQVSVEQVVDLLNARPETISLDLPHSGAEGETSLLDMLEDSEEPGRVVATQSAQEQVQALLSLLTPVERRILQLRFGLVDPIREPTLNNLYRGNRPVSEGRELGLAPVGKLVGLSHEAVSRIEERALRKLAPYCEELRAYLEP